MGSGVSCIGAALLLPPDLWQWSFPLPFPAWVGDSSLPRQGPQAAHPGHLQKLRAGQLPFRIPADAWGPGVKRALGCGGGCLRPAPGPDSLYPTLPGPCGQSRSGRTFVPTLPRAKAPGSHTCSLGSCSRLGSGRAAIKAKDLCAMGPISL